MDRYTVNCSTSVSNAQTLYGEEPDAPIRKKTTPVSLLQHAIAAHNSLLWHHSHLADKVLCNQHMPESRFAMFICCGQHSDPAFLDSLPLLAILTAFVGFQSPFPHLQLPFRDPSHAALHGQTTTIDARTNQCHTTIVAKPSLVRACTSVCLVSTSSSTY